MTTLPIASVVIFLAFTLHGTSSCSCVPMDEPITFCSPDFGIQGTVTKIEGNLTLFEDLVYSVRVLEVYHDSSDAIQVSTTIDITTPGHTCGIHFLSEGLTYLISGVTNSGSYAINNCQSVVMPYNDIRDLSNVGIPCSESPTTTTTPTTIPSSPTTSPTSLTTTATNTMAPTSRCLCDEEPTFCSSSFAIKGTVVNILGNRSLNEDLQYNVRVQEVYRNSTQAIRVNEILEIQTPASLCGIGSLKTGSSYLISGGSTSSFSIDICTSVVQEVNDVGEASVDIDLPCSASVSTITSFVIIVSVLLSVVFHW
ncbi:uncharacterized protein LOC589544 [Strongylocentrotus purpuratus]|uniref:NTR domain-containing protein n=1 Tax=Strongylocentrotus purpuratus TaxID=7668 RepID=A0A7M7NU60_STRPU|nr:uncharacterized protein LOC589544 [Strongylocentrotus purpuratus]